MQLKSVALWLGGLGCLGIATAALAQESPKHSDESVGSEEIVVTGSRTTKNGNNSPTPVTVQSAEDLQSTTPATIADGLNKLPAFQAGYNTGAVSNTTQNRGGNYLNLRGFGLNRNLVLLDGRRATPTNVDGSVDVNTLPELLVERVDVVTGGVSAVYGSDAVSGVVNFVLDHKLEGIKGVLQGNISTYGDDPGFKVGLAGGHSLFDGRLHLEGSLEHFQTNGIYDKNSRQWGRARYCQVGAGTAASPAMIASNCTWSGATTGGVITSGPGTGLSFKDPGVLSPFVHGASTATAGTEIGGEGADQSLSSVVQGLKLDQGFVRADATLFGNVTGFIQGTYSRSETQGVYEEVNLTNMTFSTSNPFLTAAERATLSAGGASTFKMGREFSDSDGPYADSVNQTYGFTVGLAGKISNRFNWDAFYTHGVADVNIETFHNINQQKLAAALDAVSSPTGQTVCRVTLTNPNLFPGCTPISLFGINSTNSDAFSSVQDTTFIDNVNRMDDVGLTFAGEVFDLPAGAVEVALSGEYRKNKLEIVAPYLSTGTPTCTGIAYNCPFPGFPAVYQQGVSSPVSASQDVSEGAFETTVPILRDTVLAKSLDLNGAARFTHYSVSGNATTWKLGATWRPIDDLTFRVTRSRDIRAPSLYDLFQPATVIGLNLNDIHTNVSGVVPRSNSGNPNLVPEVAQTLTLGAVYRPVWLPRFSLSVDYYTVKIANAILTLQASVPNDQLCESSGGTSIYCSLFARPLPFSDHSAANFPTYSYGNPLNVAVQKISGVDVESNYDLDLADISAKAPGRLAFRLLLSYQPHFYVKNTPGEPTYNEAGSASAAFEGPGPTEKTKVTGSIDYHVGPLSVDVLERWYSGLTYNYVPTVKWAENPIPSTAYTDLTLNWDAGSKKNVAFFLTVQNAFNKQPRIYTSYNGNLINFRNNIVNGDDLVGRYFTAGTRFSF